MDKKILLQESFLSNLSDYYSNDLTATEYIDKNIPTPDDLEVFALTHNISIDYHADNMQAALESFQRVIDKEKLYG